MADLDSCENFKYFFCFVHKEINRVSQISNSSTELKGEKI